MEMKTVVGKIASEWDYLTVELKDGKKIQINEKTILGYKSFHVGQKLIGEIINDKFNIQNIEVPSGTKLLNATYIKDYIYRFEFSNGKVFDTNFKPMLTGCLAKFLDVTKFKKIKYEESGNIYWGKDWDMSFHIELYYGVDKMIPHPRKYYTDYLKEAGLSHLLKKEKNDRSS